MPKSLSSRIDALEEYLTGHKRTQKEIAVHFGVDRKTVCRAIDKLSFFTELHAEKEGRNTIYFIAPKKFDAAKFTFLELAALLLSQEAISAGGTLSYGSPFASAGKSLIEKVKAKMPHKIRLNLEAVAEIIGTAVVPNKDYAQFGSVIEELTTAALDRRTVSMHYDSLSSTRNETRLFDPYNIYLDPDGATLKTIGYDHRNSRLSPFSLDRIKSIKITKEIFTRPKNYNLREYLTENCFNGIHGDPVSVRLKVKNITAGVFAERQFHPSQKTAAVKKSKNGSIEELEITMCVAGGRGLERFILSWLPDIEVLEPAELRLKIRQIVVQASI